MPLKKRTPRQQPKLTSSPIGDIAFLSLIFFLLTTTDFADLGIQAQLPPFSPYEGCYTIPERNIYRVNLNEKGQLFVRSEPTHLYDLKKKVKHFILNPENDYDFATSPSSAIVAFGSSREAKYEDYFAMYNELDKVYKEIWEVEAQKRYGASFKRLPKKEQSEIKNEYPDVLLEMQPAGFF